MLTLRPAKERGHADHGWLDTYHSFSFADYYDPKHMGFSALRVINEDRVAPARGFGTHPHQDMEIVTIVLDGELEHRDSMGNTSRIRPGEVQRMTAGTGVRHSETNPSPDAPVHLLQIWIQPAERGLPPGYEQTAFPPETLQGRLRLVASPDGREGSVTIHQDASLYLGRLGSGDRVAFAPRAGRRAYVQVAGGELRLNGQPLAAGDGVRVEDERELVFEAAGDAQVLLFDLP